METIHRISLRLKFPISETLFQNSKTLKPPPSPIFHKNPTPSKSSPPLLQNLRHYSYKSPRKPSPVHASTGFFSGFGLKKNKKKPNPLPEIVKAGDPVLHEPASEVPIGEIGSERIQKIIDDMVVRKLDGDGGMQGGRIEIIVLEDTKEYISYAPKKEIEAQDRRPFDLLVILNPKLKKKGTRTALFFEGCLSVDGFRAAVERHLEVEVTGFDRNGSPIKLDASGWQARILQHECDHLDGTIYVDKFVPKTFRTVENLDLPLPIGCPELGVQ